MDILIMDELDDNELLLYMDICFHEEPDHLKWKRLDLDKMSNEECLTKFRFRKDHIHELKMCMHIPDEITVPGTSVKCNGLEGLCILLRRFSYPNRLTDLVPVFGIHPTHISSIFNYMLEYVYETFEHLLSDLNQPWLTEQQLRRYATYTYASGIPVATCWGFIDGTVMPICRPQQNQREVYNGHKRIHALKYQSIVTPNGLIANMFGPVEGRRHDAALLAESGILNRITYFAEDNSPLCLYGDAAYPLSPHLLCPYKNAILTQEQQAFNTGMSGAREAVEWAFGKIVQNFAFVDFKKNQKMYLQPVGKYYLIAALLTNCHTCFYGSQISTYFGLEPPSINEYLLRRI